MITFGVVGTGWRTEFFLNIANALPQQFECVGVVTRHPDKHTAWARKFSTTLFPSIDEMLKRNPLFVITSVPWDVNPHIVAQLVEHNVAVLSETPPATSLEDMENLYQLVEKGAKIAVAEQYHLHPHHAARLAFVDSGKLGDVHQAHISVAHGYHGISLMRRFLGIGYENATITAKKFTAPVLKWRDRDPIPHTEQITQSEQILVHFDFGDKLGIFDFVGEQYWSPYRGQRVLVRGTHGEIIDHRATYIETYPTPIEVEFKRYYAGVDGNLEGHYLRGIQAGNDWVYENPFAPARFFDDEIAIADCLVKMADYVDGADPFYSLAEACQDRYLDIMMWEAANSGQAITTKAQMWAT